MSRHVPVVSRRESLVFNLAHVLPFYLRGIFTRSPFWVGLWSRFHPDPMARKFIATLRQKYQSDYLYLNMLGTKTLLVLDRAGIRHILNHSPAIYADAKVKRVGMAHFQPNALTISRGAEWRERRRFNEAVLYTGHNAHPYAERFLAIIRREIASPLFAGSELRWAHFAQLFERITLQILFGEGEPDHEVAAALTRVMWESNRVFALHPSRHFASFYQRLNRLLANAPQESLASLSHATPSTPRTKVENQIPHWLFAMKDTLAENVVPALALILAQQAVESRVRAEMAAADLSTAQGIHSLHYLEACIQETMRLWPTTPLLTRQTVTADTLEGIALPPGLQLLILNSFTHLDEKLDADANRFCPQIWLDGRDTGIYNHLSNGPQSCAGKELALFVAKSVIATLLATHSFRLANGTPFVASRLPETFNPFTTRFERVGRA